MKGMVDPLQHNPVTHSLIQQLNDPRLAEFVTHWDALEALVIRVFRGKAATPEDEAQYRPVWTWLREAYAQRQRTLRPYWSQVKVAGEIATEDPFAHLLAAGAARDFVGNWAAMQTLPAVREALNCWLMDLIDSRDQK
jgi:hypothetical protein